MKSNYIYKKITQHPDNKIFNDSFLINDSINICCSRCISEVVNNILQLIYFKDSPVAVYIKDNKAKHCMLTSSLTSLSNP